MVLTLGLAMRGVAWADSPSPPPEPEETGEEAGEPLRVKMFSGEGMASPIKPTRMVKPRVPTTSLMLLLESVRCVVEYYVGPDGVPYKVEPAGCPAAVFQQAEEAALLSRFEFKGMEPRRVRFQVSYMFMGEGGLSENKEVRDWMSAYAVELAPAPHHECHLALGGREGAPMELGATTDAAHCFALPLSGLQAHSEVVDLLASGCAATVSAVSGKPKSVLVTGCEKASARRFGRLVKKWHWESESGRRATYKVTARE